MDYKVRIKKLQTYLKKSGLSAFLVLTKTNRVYLSGFSGSRGYLLVTKTSAKLFVDSRYTIRAKKESPFSVQSVDDLEKSMKSLAKVGIEDSIRLSDLSLLKKRVKGVKFVETSGVVESIRSVKSSKEAKALKKGSRIVDDTFRHILKMVRDARRKKRDLTEIEISQEIVKFGKQKGADEVAFDPIVAFGANAASPHHFSSGRVIEKDNFLLLDFGMLVAGYHSDFTRTLFIGKPNKFQEKIYNTVLSAQLSAVDQIFDGAKASAVDKKARGLIEGEGYGENYTHNGGHGVGLEIHELPNFFPESKDILKQGMIVTIEPGIYLPKKFGVRIEDMVHVKKSGSETLSKIPKDLKSMIIN